MRKTIVLIMCSCFCALLSEAQIKKSTVVAQFSVGDIIAIRINKSQEKDQKNIFQSGVGYFIKDNWEVGINFNYTHINFIFADYAKKTNTLGIGIYSNYYFGRGKLKPYVTFQTGWRHEKGSSYSGWVGHKNINRSYFYADPGVGLNWNIKSKFSLFNEAAYSQDDLNLSFGIRLFFNKMKKH